MPEWQTLFSALREHDINVSGRDMPRPVGGGDISAAWRVKSADNSVFLKTGPGRSYEMFRAEAEGLKELAISTTGRDWDSDIIWSSHSLLAAMGGISDGALESQSPGGVGRLTFDSDNK